MHYRFSAGLFVLVSAVISGCAATSITNTSVSRTSLVSSDLCYKPAGVSTRWASFENPLGGKGRGGMENKGAKGHAFDILEPGETKTLMDTTGSGVIHRIWVTINPRNATMLRSLKLEMFWDNSDKPAVSVPFGDFFNFPAGRMTPFESSLFCSPEGKSFVCTIPMPFKDGARVTLTNESDKPLMHLFYDIDYTIGDKFTDETLYFHACWNRQRWTTLEKDFEILPKVVGSGRFLGCNIAVMIKPGNGAWWGEGEVKVYLDGDGDWPTLVGTGLEDYVSTGWGLKSFAQLYHGCPIADEVKGIYGFYRYHVPDPVYFDRNCRVTIQQMGGGSKKEIVKMVQDGANIKPITVARLKPQEFIKLMELSEAPDVTADDFADGWINFYREDDYAATALFYLDSPISNLPELAPVEKRLKGLEQD